MELSNEDQMMYWLQCPSPHKTWTISFGLESIRALVWLLIRCKELLSRLWSDNLVWEKYHYKATVWYKCGAIPPGRSAGEKAQKNELKNTLKKSTKAKMHKSFWTPRRKSAEKVQKNAANKLEIISLQYAVQKWEIFATLIIDNYITLRDLKIKQDQYLLAALYYKWLKVRRHSQNFQSKQELIWTNLPAPWKVSKSISLSLGKSVLSQKRKSMKNVPN